MRKRWIAVVAVVAVLAVAAGAVWYFVFRDDSPAEVSLESATDSLGRKSSGATSTSGGTPSTAGLDGTWNVDQTIGSFSDFSSTFAGFRVQEELAGIGAKTAVGRTPKVTGSMTVEGTRIPNASFEVDMTTLTTDDSRRDGQLRTQAIETNRFPTASFRLTQPITLPKVPAEGEEITVNATGDLTVHGVTKQVTIPLEAQRTGRVIAVVGSITIPFADFDISPPRSAIVLSVDDKAVMEVQLFFTKA